MKTTLNRHTLTSFGHRLRALRREYLLTQKEVREIAGLSAAFYSDLENGKQQPSATTLASLADTFDVSMDWLWRGKGRRDT